MPGNFFFGCQTLWTFTLFGARFFFYYLLLSFILGHRLLWNYLVFFKVCILALLGGTRAAFGSSIFLLLVLFQVFNPKGHVLWVLSTLSVGNVSCSQPSLALRIVLWAPSSGSFPSTDCFFMCNWDLRGSPPTDPRSLFFSLCAVLFSPIIYLTNSSYLGLSVSELCVLVSVRPPRLSPDNIGAVERLTSCVSLLSGIIALCYLLSVLENRCFIYYIRFSDV